MEKRMVRFEFDVTMNDSSRLDLNKALKQVQHEHQRDSQEKEEFQQLNNRFTLVLTNIDQLKQINQQLQLDLKDELILWGILPRDEQTLRPLVGRLNQQTQDYVADEIHRRAAEQDTVVLNRLVLIYNNVQQMYRRHQENLRGVIEHYESECSQMKERQRHSEEELNSVEQDLNEELKKFHQRLGDWSELVIEKQVLHDDVQSLRERINLIHALNEEEIEEWKRLLTESKDESRIFYREELTNAIREIKRDYAKQTKQFQNDLEYQIEGQLQMVEHQLKQKIDSTDESSEKTRSTMDETKLQSMMDDYDRQRNQVNDLTKLVSNKRRLLRDEEAKFHEIQRRFREKHREEQTRTEQLRHQCEETRQHFEQMALQLRFSVEDELRIYARLLDELTKDSSHTTKKSISSMIQSIVHEESPSIFDDSSSGIFHLADVHENEIHETFDGSASILN